MVAPLKLKGSETTGTSDSQNPTIPAGVPVYGIQEMTGTEIADSIIYKILKEFSKIDLAVPKTGDITLLDTVGDNATTDVGDFIDTTRTNAVGTRNAISQLSKVNTTSTSIYQVLTAITGAAIVRPVCWKNGALREMTDEEIFTTIIDPALNKLTNRGLGSYHFSSGAPRDPSTNAILGGTWTSLFSVTDNYKSGQVGSNRVTTTVVEPISGGASVAAGAASISYYVMNASSKNESITYTMWRKTEDASVPSATTPRPLKFVNSAELGKHLTEMTNADILTLLVPFRNAIITSGKGKYTFRATAPTSGVWAKRGDKVEDLLNVLSESNYSWGYARKYTNYYTGYFIHYYTGYFTGYYHTTTTAYYGGRGVTSLGDDYTGVRAKSYTNTYTRADPTTYVNVAVNNYTAPVVSADVLPEITEFLWVKREN